MARQEWKGYPRGWFVVALADDLPVGGVKRLSYLGQEWVAFRGESGAVAVLDAYCPHMGAHLGVGGTVLGDTVRCPFHAWQFGADGGCAAIPYASMIPRQAHVRAHEVRERNGLVFVWSDPQGGPPGWEIPALEGHGGDEWLAWDADCLRVRTHPREIVENVADKAHFPVVHGTHVDQFDNEYLGHLAIQRTRGVAYPRGGGVDRFQLTATYHGPAFQLTEMEGVLHSRLFIGHTPVNETELDLRFGVSLRVRGDRVKMEGFARHYIDNLRTGFHEDLQIWEHKQYRDPPLLAENDGPIGRLRAWYRQFYSASPETAAG